MRSEHDCNPVHPDSQMRRHARSSVITVTGFRVPQLRLIGRWLESAGFEVGTWAEVRAGAGRIVIEAQGNLAYPGAAEQRSARRRSLRS
jgi:hypothetical protein